MIGQISALSVKLTAPEFRAAGRRNFLERRVPGRQVCDDVVLRCRFPVRVRRVSKWYGGAIASKWNRPERCANVRVCRWTSQALKFWMRAS